MKQNMMCSEGRAWHLARTQQTWETIIMTHLSNTCIVGFPGGASGKGSACRCKRCKRHRLNPWVGKIPWRRGWQPTAVFLPGKPHGQEEPGGLQSMGLQRVQNYWAHKVVTTQQELFMHHLQFFPTPPQSRCHLFLSYRLENTHVSLKKGVNLKTCSFLAAAL